ncbi:CHAT domain-containing protein [Streptomyces sp. MMS24-I2-30]|uniref:CHAT domain-containing protein n=1 Tax=Streptomyces sp. MMS24-I2-30 TaxID=3351564 RepID=UPI003896E77B
MSKRLDWPILFDEPTRPGDPIAVLRSGRPKSERTEALRRLASAARNGNPPDINRFAAGLLWNGDPYDAVRVWRVLLAQQPDMLIARLNLATCHLVTGLRAECARVLRACRDSANPGTPERRVAEQRIAELEGEAGQTRLLELRAAALQERAELGLATPFDHQDLALAMYGLARLPGGEVTGDDVLDAARRACRAATGDPAALEILVLGLLAGDGPETELNGTLRKLEDAAPHSKVLTVVRDMRTARGDSAEVRARADRTRQSARGASAGDSDAQWAQLVWRNISPLGDGRRPSDREQNASDGRSADEGTGTAPSRALRGLAEDLMATDSVERAEGLLTQGAGHFDPHALLGELTRVREELLSRGRPAEAAVADFHHGTVERLRLSLTGPRNVRNHIVESGVWDSAPDFLRSFDTVRQASEREALTRLRRGDLDTALVLLHNAAMIPPFAPEERVRSAGLRLHLAGELRDAGRAVEALALLNAETLGPDTGGPLAGDSRTQLLRSRYHFLRGLLCDDCGAYEQARYSFREAMDAASSGGDREGKYQAHSALAFSYLKAGRAREGVREFRRVLANTEANGGRLPPVLNNLGSAYRDAGEIRAARSCFTRARELAEEEGAQGISMATALLGIGDLARDEGNEEEAGEAYFQAMMKCLSPAGGVLELTLAAVVTRFKDMGELGDLLMETAELLHSARGGTFDSWEARAMFRTAQASRNQRAGRHAEAVASLRALHTSATRQPSGTQIQIVTTGYLARALTRWGAERPEALQEAFDVLWEARGRLLTILSDGAVQDRPALVALHHSVYEHLIELLVDHGSAVRPPTSEPTLELAFDLHEEYKTWTSGAGRQPITPARFAALRNWLRAHHDAADCAFVSYFCGSGDMTAFSYVPQTDRLTAVRTPLDLDVLRQAAERLRRTFDGDPDAFPPQGQLPPQRPWKRSLAFFDELAPALLAVLPHVTGRDLLCIAADGPLHDLPLHALPVPGDDGLPLAHRHAVVQVGNATTLLMLGGLPPARGSSTVYVGAVAAHEDGEPGRLERDAEIVSAGGWHVTGTTGVEATPDVVASELRAASVAHLTAHGWFDTAEPMDSGVLLAYGGQRPPREPYTVDIRTRLDHLLTARRLAGEGLRLDLMTLRACSTARRDPYSTGHMEGIVQALLHSGVRTVVATLWNVDDTSSRRLFTDFYRHLLGEGDALPEQPPWRAFWDAQRAMLRQPAGPWESHPFHWAAVALFGLWRHT